MPVQGIPLTLADNKNWKFNAASPARAAQRPRLEPRDVRQRRAAEEQALRPPDRLGSGGAEGKLGRRARVAVERRHAHHRRQPRVPGHRRRPLHRLQRARRQEAVGDGHRHRRRRGPSTYEVDGKQYVSIAVGWGGVYGIAAPGHRAQGPGHGLHVRRRRQGGAARPSSSTRWTRCCRACPTTRRSARPARAVRQQLRVLPRRARGGPRRQRPEPRLLDERDDLHPRQVGVQRARRRRTACPISPASCSPPTCRSCKAFIQGTADAVRPKSN